MSEAQPTGKSQENHMLARKLIVAIALVAVAATACGSSSKSSASSPTSPTSPSATTASGGGSTATTTPSKSYSGSSGSSFCDLAKKDENAFNAKGFTGTSPADLKKLYGNLEPALEEAQSKAPDAIKADFATFVTAYKQVIKAFADANYDVTKISPTAFAGFADPKIKAAADHITQYTSQVCHITPTT
jgi:ABC-type phosphate/phosphonate transport system substrate-binding protein